MQNIKQEGMDYNAGYRFTTSKTELISPQKSYCFSKFVKLLVSTILHNCLGILSKIRYKYQPSGKGVLAYRLQRRTACKIQNGRLGAQKWQTGSGKVSTPRFLGVLSKFR